MVLASIVLITFNFIYDPRDLVTSFPNITQMLEQKEKNNLLAVIKQEIVSSNVFFYNIIHLPLSVLSEGDEEEDEESGTV